MQVFGVMLALSCCCVNSFGQTGRANGGAQSPSPATPLQRLLADRALWGKDGPTALAAVQAWSRAGESKVAIFSQALVGATPFTTDKEAAQQARRLSSAAMAPLPRPNRAMESYLRSAHSPQRPPLQVRTIPTYYEDDSARVVVAAPSAQFLAPALTVATVYERLGQPEKVSSVLIQNRSDMRPVILKLHSYLGGTVIFAESNYAAHPGIVDRVIVDLPAVTAALFKEAK